MSPPPRLLGSLEDTSLGERVYWLECPGCGRALQADDEQYHGDVSLDCPHCDYHETHDVSEQKPDGLPF